jgi:hypothetical protein
VRIRKTTALPSSLPPGDIYRPDRVPALYDAVFSERVTRPDGPDRPAPSPQALSRAVALALATLGSNPRGMVVIERRFGLVGEIETLEVVGRDYGISGDRVREIEVKALRMLRYPRRAELLWAPFKETGPVESQEPKE